MPKTDFDLQIIIPAAGASARLGQAKQMVQTNSGQLWQQILNICLPISRNIALVTGHWRPSVHLPAGITECYFPDWSSGMGASIAYGVKQSPRPKLGYLIVLIDQWGLTANALQTFVSLWDKQSVQMATDANYNGPPVLLPVHFYDQLSQLSGDQGAKSFLLNHNPTVQTVLNASWDLDTQQDLKNFQQMNKIKTLKDQQHDFT